MERTMLEVNGSLLLTVPRGYARRLGLRKGSRMNVEMNGQQLIVEHVKPKGGMGEVVTLGYEGRTVAGLVADLQAQHVRQLIDVRQLPLSRRKGFSKTSLSQALVRVGIAYRHEPKLGAPKLVRDPYKKGGSFDKFRHEYLGHLASVPERVDALKWQASQERTALLCVEQDHSKCHRQFLADTLAGAGFRVQHI